MRFRRRDHEPFIGGYDPEHEMPNPRRDPRDRWQSEAYRDNARDSRFAYRWNPDRIEDRDRDREEWMRRRAMDREIQPRDRYENRYGGYGMLDRYDRDREDRGYGYDRGYDRPYDARFDREYDRGYRYGYGYGYDRHPDRDPGYGVRDRSYEDDWRPNRDRWNRDNGDDPVRDERWYRWEGRGPRY